MNYDHVLCCKTVVLDRSDKYSSTQQPNNLLICPGNLPILRSEAKSWREDSETPNKAYDWDYKTFYKVKEGDAEGNFLKLYLPEKSTIGRVKLINTKDACCKHSIVGTMVTVYSTAGGKETKVVNCGEMITGDYSRSYFNRNTHE